MLIAFNSFVERIDLSFTNNAVVPILVNSSGSIAGVYPLPPSNELPHLIPHPQHPPPHPQAVSLQPQPQPHPAGYPSSYGVGPPPQGAPPPQGFWAHRPPMHPGYPPIHPAYGYPPMAGGQPIVYHHPGYSAHPMMRMTHMQQQDLVKMPNGPNPLEWAAMQRQKVVCTTFVLIDIQYDWAIYKIIFHVLAMFSWECTLTWSLQEIGLWA